MIPNARLFNVHNYKFFSFFFFTKILSFNFSTSLIHILLLNVPAIPFSIAICWDFHQNDNLSAIIHVNIYSQFSDLEVGSNARRCPQHRLVIISILYTPDII